MDEQLEITLKPTDEVDTEVLALTCTEDENGDLIIEWDETDPQAISLGINEWSVERWNQLLRDARERAAVICDELSQAITTQPIEGPD